MHRWACMLDCCGLFIPVSTSLVFNGTNNDATMLEPGDLRDIARGKSQLVPPQYRPATGTARRGRLDLAQNLQNVTSQALPCAYPHTILRLDRWRGRHSVELRPYSFAQATADL